MYFQWDAGSNGRKKWRYYDQEVHSSAVGIMLVVTGCRFHWSPSSSLQAAVQTVIFT